MSRILVAGSLAYDRIMEYPGNFTDSLMPDKLHALSVSFTVPHIREHFGGCAGNIAYALALLGEKPQILATAGSDFGRYQEHLQECDIDTFTVHVDGDDFTSVANIVTDRADNQITAFAIGAGEKPYGALPELDEYDCAMLSAGNVADTLALADAAKQRSLPYYFDPGQGLPSLSGEQLRTLIEGAAGIFANDYEFALIKDKTGWSEEELLSRTPLIVVTLGAKGSQLIRKEGETSVAAVPAKLVDPTGAGDAHRAGFLKGVAADLPLKQCAQLASTVAAYAVEAHGTQEYRFTLPELQKRYQEAYGEPLPL